MQTSFVSYIALTRRTTVYRIHTFSFPAHIFIECCPIKLRQHSSPCVLSFELTILHCSRKYKPSDQISSAGTILIQLQSGSIPAIYYEERGDNTTGVCRQLHKWRASAHQQRGPVQSCRHHIVRRWWRTYTGNVYRTNVECEISMICPFCTSPFISLHGINLLGLPIIIIRLLGNQGKKKYLCSRCHEMAAFKFKPFIL